MHGLTLITTIAAGFGLALILGFVAVRLGLPALIGYLLAGVVIGPATPGYVADLEIAGQLAEIGVMLLMFGVGLHFSFQDLLSVRRIALPGAIVQIAVATALGAGLATLWGWNLYAGIVFGFALSVASTVVLLRALEARGELDSVNGRIAVGWLVVEDLVTVLVLVLMPPLAAIIAKSQTADAGAMLPHPCDDRRRDRPVRRADARRRATVVSVAAVAGGAHGLARALHAVRDRRRARHRVRLRGIVRRVLRTRRLFRRDGAA